MPRRFEVNDVHSLRCLKDVRVLLSILSPQYKKQQQKLDVSTRIWPFSVQSLQKRVLKFEIFTIDTRVLRVNAKGFWPLPDEMAVPSLNTQQAQKQPRKVGVENA